MARSTRGTCWPTRAPTGVRAASTWKQTAQPPRAPVYHPDYHKRSQRGSNHKFQRCREVAFGLLWVIVYIQVHPAYHRDRHHPLREGLLPAVSLRAKKWAWLAVLIGADSSSPELRWEPDELPRLCLTCGCALLRRGRGWCAFCNAGLHKECLLACAYAAPCGHMFCPKHRHSHFGHAPILHGNNAVMTEERRGQPGQLHREGMSAPAGSSSLPLGSSPPSTRRIASRSQSSDSSPPAVIPLTDSESDHTASTGADGMVIWV